MRALDPSLVRLRRLSLAGLLALASLARPAQAAAFTVTTTADSGPGSLRQAILDANLSAGLDTITFAIGAAGSQQTIALAAALPAITDPAVLDGWSQGGAGYAGPPLIEINGGGLANWNTVTGLQVTGGSSTVRGLAVNYFNIAVSLESAGGNVIAGNSLGLALDGVTAVGNRTGIRITAASDGNRLGTDGDGVNDVAERNVIAASGLVQQNNSFGILIDSGSDNNWIAGNYIGTDASGTLDRGNAETGIVTGGLTIIGTNGDGVNDEVEGNLISGNGGHGIALATAASGSRVAGNRIGTDLTGAVALPNAGDGVSVGPCFGGCSNLILGTNGDGVSDALEGNLISGNGAGGVFIPAGTLSNNVVAGNRIGVNLAGTAALPNGDTGVHLGGDLSRLGTNSDGVSDALEANLISGNGDGAGNDNHGVVIPPGADGHTLAGNRVGTDFTGLAALPNGQNGVHVSGAGHILSGNLIAGNGGHGLSLSDAFSVTVTGNLIGVAADGVTPLGNGGHGVYIGLNSDGNTVGGAGQGNLIAHNGGDGVFVDSNCGAAHCLRNAIRGNRLFGNGGLGLDLAPNGVTPNDPTDADSGPNTLQNFPVLTAVDNTGGVIAVTGTLTSTAATTFTLNFFAGPACDPGGYGEGQNYLGEAAVTTGADGVAAFGITLAASVPYSHSVTATATGLAGDTSEFSACLPALGNQPVAGLQAASDSPAFLGQSTRFTATVGAGSGVAFAWDFGDGVGAEGATVSHVYTAAGTYTATVTAANAINTLTATTAVEVLPPPACAATPDDGATLFTSADAGAVQQAVNAAPAGGLVKVAGVCAGAAPAFGLTQTLYIDRPLTLAGGFRHDAWAVANPSANATVLDGQGLGRVILVTAGYSVTIADLTIQNGYAGAAPGTVCPYLGCGGGIFTLGALRLVGVTVQDNYAVRSGGGAYVEGALETVDSLWRDNTCSEVGRGGALEAWGATSIAAGRFEANACGYAGALFVYAPLAITNTQFVSNTAVSPTFGSGGAIYAVGPLSLVEARFERNTARTGAGAVIHSSLAVTDSALITATDFISNTALNAGAQGGALSTNAPSAVIQDSVFEGNTVPGASGSGGAIVAFRAITLTQVSLISNTAGSQGGGLYHWGLNEPGDTGQVYPLVISGGVLNGNTAGDEGGGLYFRQGFQAENVPVLITDTVFAGNRAGHGGGAYLGQPAQIAGSAFHANASLAPNGLQGSGGGLYAAAALDLRDTDFQDNSASTGGGGYLAGPATIQAGQLQANQAVIGGGLYVTATATLAGTHFISNTAAFGGGGLFLARHPLALTNTLWAGNAAPFFGGAVYAETGRLAITRGVFESNEANGGGAIYALYSPDLGDTLTVADSVFRGNAAVDLFSPLSGYGGALYAQRPIAITRTTFEGNTATSTGGAAVIVADAVIAIADAVFMGNTAGVQGGGLYLRAGIGVISGAVFSLNRAELGGGALIDTAPSPASTLVITASQIISNTAVQGGGLLVSDMPLDLENTVILSNTAEADGGGLWVQFGPAEVRHSTLAGNAAGRDGGGLWANGASLTVAATNFFGNRAGLSGGALALRGLGGPGSLIVNSVLADNDAGPQGAAIHHAAAGALNLFHVTLARQVHGSGMAVRAEAGSVALTNTIVANHAVGLLATGSAAITASHTLFFGNGQDLTGTVTSQAAVPGDPRFLSPARRNYHLNRGSAAIDAGTLAGVGTDIDGYLRHAGQAPDIGADEFGARALVLPGQWLQLSAPVAPSGTVTLTLPAGAVSADTLVDLAPEDTSPRPLPPGASFAGASFRVSASPAGGPQLAEGAGAAAGFAQPVVVAVAYPDVAGLDEGQLRFWRWDEAGGAWRDAVEDCAGAGAYARDPAADWLSGPVCAPGEFALVAAPHQVFLPALHK